MRKIVFVLGIIIVGSIFSGYTVGASASQYSIPPWVKAVAGFWAEGNITDDDFGEGISFLIDQGILQIPKIQELENEVSELKSKNDKLKDDTQYLEEKIFQKDFIFSMDQPSNWEKQRVYSHPIYRVPVYSMIEYSTLQEAEPATIAVIIQNSNGLTLEEFVKDDLDNVSELLNSIGEFTVHDMYWSDDPIIGDKELILEYSLIIESNPQLGGYTLRGQDTFVEHRGQVFTIGFGATEKNFDKHFEQYLEILGTWKFLSVGTGLRET